MNKEDVIAQCKELEQKLKQDVKPHTDKILEIRDEYAKATEEYLRLKGINDDCNRAVSRTRGKSTDDCTKIVHAYVAEQLKQRSIVEDGKYLYEGIAYQLTNISMNTYDLGDHKKVQSFIDSVQLNFRKLDGRGQPDTYHEKSHIPRPYTGHAGSADSKGNGRRAAHADRKARYDRSDGKGRGHETARHYCGG